MANLTLEDLFKELQKLNNKVDETNEQVQYKSQILNNIMRMELVLSYWNQVPIMQDEYNGITCKVYIDAPIFDGTYDFQIG